MNKDWDRLQDLHRIRVPTLVLGGTTDEMGAKDLRKMGQLLPNARVAIVRAGTHLSMYDRPKSYFEKVVKFVKDVDGGRFRRKLPDNASRRESAGGLGLLFLCGASPIAACFKNQ